MAHTKVNGEYQPKADIHRPSNEILRFINCEEAISREHIHP